MAPASHSISIDTDAQTLTIDGLRFGLGYFTAMARAPLRTAFRVVGNEDGVLTLETIDEQLTARLSLADKNTLLDAEGYARDYASSGRGNHVNARMTVDRLREMLSRITRSAVQVPPEERYMGSKALADIAMERGRQINGEGFVPEHDDRYTDDSLATAAACYILHPLMQMATSTRNESDGKQYQLPRLWPWHASWWKPGTPAANPLVARRRQLVKAGALITAEIERIDRIDQQ